jgi:hypothetical protein
LTYEEKREALREFLDRSHPEVLGREFSEALYSCSEMGLFADLDIEDDLAYDIVACFLAVKNEGFPDELVM